MCRLQTAASLPSNEFVHHHVRRDARIEGIVVADHQSPNDRLTNPSQLPNYVNFQEIRPNATIERSGEFALYNSTIRSGNPTDFDFR
jgi:hypothetical protein